MNTQKPRYDIGYVDPKTLREELKRVVDSGEYPKYDTQFGRKTYVITRELCSLPAKLLGYFRRK